MTMTVMARATITIEVDGVGGSWGPECTMGQVHAQAAEGARSLIRSRLETARVRIIGEPKITVMVFDDAATRRQDA